MLSEIRIALAALLTLLGAATAVPETASADPAYSSTASARPRGLDVTGWVLADAKNRLVDRNAAGLSTLSIDGLGLRAHGNGVLAPADGAARLARRGHHHGLSVELLLSNYSNSLGDFDATALHRLLASAAHRRHVAARVAAYVRRGGYDGVNVDLELVRARDGGRLVAFVRRLQRALPAATTVSIDISASTSLRAYRRHGYRLGALGRAVDVVDLMTYDYSGPTWSGPGPIGPLPWQRKAMKTLLKRVPAAKAQLGFGGYGYTWPAHRTGRTVTDAGARRRVAHDGATAHWHPRIGEWSAKLSNGTRLWWSDKRSYRKRITLARDLGVRGLAVWRLGSADRLR
ncbi:MAG: glycosyl hydrolase family 18 protein [Nocardioides sp.]|uniref:glycosyl hydrolase family 18 protein n=1 Tax=Nocardioides sp. TaxID=35761 RepID=UPI0039E65723